jgi:hypothetical protein
MTPTLVTIQTVAPRGKSGGTVAQAYYIVKDNRVTLTDRDGITLHDPEGGDYSRTLNEGDNPRQVAGRLLRSFRTKFKGERVRGFDGPLHYEPIKY